MIRNWTNCNCEQCRIERSTHEDFFPYDLMYLCPICHNKRCPKIDWHGYKCTGSNAVNQIPEIESDENN